MFELARPVALVSKDQLNIRVHTMQINEDYGSILVPVI
jgi:hypothetical protein